MTRFRTLLGALGAAGLTAVVVGLMSFVQSPVGAQTSLTATTLSSAAGTDANSATSIVRVTSATGVASGNILYVDREAMTVLPTYVAASTQVPVQRGTQGTNRAAHASGAVVYVGAPSLFSASVVTQEVAGVCTAGAELATPKVYLQSGNIYQCVASRWRVIRRFGTSDFAYPSLGNGGGTAYTALGAITTEPGFVFLNGTTLAMTLSNPTTDQNGLVMCIISENASAHTVTYTAGFGGGTTARDTATFGGAINDGFCIVARSSLWWVVPTTRNVTIA